MKMETELTAAVDGTVERLGGLNVVVNCAGVGTPMKVIGKKGDWYKVTWDSKGSEGWVFKGAIGM